MTPIEVERFKAAVMTPEWDRRRRELFHDELWMLAAIETFESQAAYEADVDAARHKVIVALAEILMEIGVIRFDTSVVVCLHDDGVEPPPYDKFALRALVAIAKPKERT